MVVNSSVPELWNMMILQNDWSVSWHGWASIYSLPTGLESGWVYQHKNRQLYASWPWSPGKFNLPVQTYPLGPWAVWDWTQVNKSFYSELCLSPPGATLCWGKTIQDFILVALCFNPFCNTHNKTSHSCIHSENNALPWWQMKTSMYYLPLREGWISFLLSSSVVALNGVWDYASQSMGACLFFSDLPLLITRRNYISALILPPPKSLDKCSYKTLWSPLEWAELSKELQDLSY